MGYKPGVRHYFVEGITNRGYISLLPDMMLRWIRVYVLMGGPGTGKSTMIKMLGLELLDRGYEVDFLRSARDPDSMAGFILRRINLAMLDMYEIAPQSWRAPGVVEKFVDLTSLCDTRKLEKQRMRVLETEEKLRQCQKEVGESLAEEFGEKVREKLYSPREDRIQPWMLNLYSSVNMMKGDPAPWPKVQHVLKKLQKSIITSFLLHGLDTEGWLNLAPHYLADYDQIRLDGEETSEAMDWVLYEAEQLGQVIEIVLHPLYPDKIIGIVFPERNLAIWQGAPDNLHDQGLGQPFRPKLKEALVSYQKYRDLLKSIYMEAIDFARVDQLREDLLNQILRDLEN